MSPIPSQTTAVILGPPLAAAGLLAVAAGAVFVVGMRTKSPQVQGAVRRMNKAFWNPRSMETAGTPGAYASVIHHVGRRSGTDYQTPVVPTRTEQGFVIVLPYGTRADWVQNVLAAGRGTITHEGTTHEFDRPEVVPIESAGVSFSRSERASHRVFRADQCLRLHVADPERPRPDDESD
jgi:deazaflavin-dependent oxidoreductase (nitroreductase family)